MILSDPLDTSNFVKFNIEVNNDMETSFCYSNFIEF